MEQENNSVIYLFDKLSQILNTKKPSQKKDNPSSNNSSLKSSKATVNFLTAHERRKNEILNKNKPHR